MRGVGLVVSVRAVGGPQVKKAPYSPSLESGRARNPWWAETFGEVGVELLEERPPNPRPQGALALPTPGELRIPGLIFTLRGVEKQLKNLCDDFFFAAAPCLHYLVLPHLTIPWSHKPPKHNVAVPINKVEGRLGGANPVGGGVGVAHHPMRGVGN